MSKRKTHYACQECGAIYPKWIGRCEACQAWNTIVEEESYVATSPRGNEPPTSFFSLSGAIDVKERFLSGANEFDRVCGGGIVPGSVILMGGDPGIGKSTLLLQIVAQFSKQLKAAYISGEESVDQIRLRAKRLKVDQSPVLLAASTNVESILATLAQQPDIKLVVIDSIQTIYSQALASSPGTVGQVRTCAHEVIQFAKQRQIITIFIGHVTKDGTMAGPKVLEHMVDTVLYFEGERNHHFRLLRAVKNRFGPSNEIGVFEMTEIGLLPVENPSALFLSQRTSDISGTAIFSGIEGTRALLVEIQALVATTTYAAPKRTVVGWDFNRLSMILAVLEARGNLSFAKKDVYLNIVGGYRITEPAADLACAVAMVSALIKIPLPSDTVFLGEVGLTGEIRPVSHTPVRLKEADKLGFKYAIIPRPYQEKTKSDDLPSIHTMTLEHISELVPFLRNRLKESTA